MAWIALINACGRITNTLASWLKSYWLWLVGALAFAGAFLWKVLSKSTTNSPKSPVRINAAAETFAAESIQQIQQTAIEREKAFVDTAEQERQSSIQTLQVDTTAVSADATQTNGYLRSTGVEMRKP
jgi:hypothetical protein